MLRPWSDRLIDDCGEPLKRLRPELLCLQPHPYQRLGAPYGPGADPFVLRAGVVRRLIAAEQQLQAHDQELRFVIFDAWRPVSVQAFMVDHAVAEECARLGINLKTAGSAADIDRAIAEVRHAVGRFWAPPSLDPTTPPPHSTGAAVDLTLAGRDGDLLEMGGEIDAIGPVSEPDHYANTALAGRDAFAVCVHQRRCLLDRVLGGQGFVRHPNEWWHFSFGDQLWAWRSGAQEAIYGRCDQALSSSDTA